MEPAADSKNNVSKKHYRYKGLSVEERNVIVKLAGGGAWTGRRKIGLGSAFPEHGSYDSSSG